MTDQQAREPEVLECDQLTAAELVAAIRFGKASEARGVLAVFIARHREQAAADEREACAKIADDYANTSHDCDDEARTDSAIRIGKRIRARGKP